MKRSTFLLIVAILALVFGVMMFFTPSLAASQIGLNYTKYTSSLLRGMGGLIIGSGLINLLTRNTKDFTTAKAILLTNVITHALGLCADIWGVVDGVLTISKMSPVEITHLFSGIGSLVYWIYLHNAETQTTV